MARVTKIELKRKERHTVHAATTYDCTIFESEGKRYLQLDTFGSRTRKDRGKISQSLQFDEQAAEALRRLLDQAFPLR